MQYSAMAWPPWPTAVALASTFQVPPDFALRLVCEADFETLPQALLRWHPRIAVGSGSIYLRPDFLRTHVVHEQLPSADIFAVVLTHHDKPVGFQAFERQLGARTLRARLGVLAPEARTGLLGAFGFLLFEKVGELVGAQVLHTWVTLIAKNQQVFAERRGFRLCGLASGADFEWVDGKAVPVTEALYVKLLGAPAVEPLERSNLTHNTQRVLEAIGGFDVVIR
jgi:hypothetical protein